MKTELTDRQQEILSFIEAYLKQSGYPPTLREICANFNIASTFGVKRHLDALEKKGFVRVEGNASRGITLLKNNSDDNDESRDYTAIPVIGRVAAGSPITAIENREGKIVIDPSFLKRSESCYALKVKGDSMINAGIFEGDLVIVNPVQDAENGDIIVAMLEDEVTVKTLFKKNSSVMLIPENDKYQPINVTGNENFHVTGKVVGVIRWLQ